MSSTFEATVVIDLENKQGWERATLPTSVAIMPPFRITEENARLVPSRVHDALRLITPFAAGVETRTSGDSKVRRLAEPALMRMHLETLQRLRPMMIGGIDFTRMGDAYDPLVQSDNELFTIDRVRVNDVSFTVSIPRGNSFIWSRGLVIKLGGAPRDQSAA